MASKTEHLKLHLVFQCSTGWKPIILYSMKK